MKNKRNISSLIILQAGVPLTYSGFNLYGKIVQSTELFVAKGADIKRSLSYAELHKFKSNTEQISAILHETR